MYYLAYGSNLNLKDLAKRVPQYKVCKAFYLEGYRLAFNHYLTIIKEEGQKVPVVLFELEDKYVRNLDIYEEYPTLYAKVYFDLFYEQKPIKTLVYIMQDNKDGKKPTKRYLKKCIAAYHDFAFPLSYLEAALIKINEVLKLEDFL